MFCVKAIIDRIVTQTQQFIIFIRHAEKNLSATVKDDNDLDITVTGSQEISNLARYLQRKLGMITQIKTSPVKRCLQTADILASSLNEPPAINLSKILGNPGPYIIDASKATKTFEQYSVYEVLKNQLRGNCLPGIREADEGSMLLINEIKNDISTSFGSIIYISHDVILTAFIANIIKDIEFDESQWINYLHGVCISYAKNKLILHTANHDFEINQRD